MVSISVPSVIAAGVGAAGSIGSSLISSNAASSAASAQQQSSQQALQLQQQEFAQTQANEAPYLSAGSGALSQLETLYGIPQSGAGSGAGTAAYSGVGVSTPQAPSYEGYSEGGLNQAQSQSVLSQRPDVLQGYNGLSGNVKTAFQNNPDNYADYWYNRYGGNSGLTLPSVAATPASGATGTSYLNATGGSSTVNPDASFYMSPDYNFALQQGLNGLNASYAAQGLSGSGAAAKAAIGYSSGLATQDYQNYANTLKGLAASGQAAASSQAATGATYAGLGTSTLTTAGNNAASSALAQGTLGSNTTSALAGQISSYLQSNPGLGSSFTNPTGWANGPPASLYGG